MTSEDIEMLLYRIESDGLDYAMKYYSDWSEIDDATFQELRNAYIKCRDDLITCVNNLKTEVIEEDET